MAKLKKCKACGADVANGARACPSCGKDNRSFFSKHKIISGFLVLVLLGIFGSALGGGTTTSNSTNSASNTATQQTAQKESTTVTPAAQTTPVAEEKPVEKAVPTEYKSALNKATSYANVMNMSKIGVYNQLISEYGEKFTKEAAQYAIDNVKADWNANALAKAKSYQEKMSMSPSSIRDQLVSEYGENFTADEADYAIKHLND